jgi:hypothetical protein
MKKRITALLAIMCLAWPGSANFPVSAQTNATADDRKLAVVEKDACTQNLKVIYDAIQRYRADHKDIPNWLSDLVPQYITDANVLICPVCKRTGETESTILADPKMPCSYLYEFCPVPLGKLPNGLTKTRREWKRRQMGLVGALVPIVRCQHHGVVLNLAYDGRIYESPASWKVLVTNMVNIADLDPDRIFAADGRVGGAPAIAAYPARDPQARPGLINLSAYYNASLQESWLGNPAYSLAALPTGVQNLGGVDYDLRGIIQAGCKAPVAKRFPARINGIKIQQKCARLHFLHATGYGGLGDEGQQVATYLLHYAANKMQLEIPIIYGRDLRDWRPQQGEKPSAELNVAWPDARGSNAPIRLFTTTWDNVAPGVEIESIDFISSMGAAAPFLVAITAE